MNKGKHKKIVKWVIIFLLILLFVNTCMMTKVPDKLRIIHEPESIATLWHKTQRKNHDFILGHVLQPTFDHSIFWPGDNDDRLYMRGTVVSEERYNALYIREISYTHNEKKYVLFEDEYVHLARKDYFSVDKFLVYEDNEPVMVNGKTLYVIWVHIKSKIKFDFKPKSLGQATEIELTQIYSINKSDYREEKYKYKVICGGRKFDITRPFKKLRFFSFLP